MGSDADKTSPGVRLGPAALIAVVAIAGALAFLLLRERDRKAIEVEAGQTMQLTSKSFSDGASIPSRYTCDGAGISPNLEWSGAPASTKSFVLIVHDPDAPADFTHWLAYDIPANVRQLADGASSGGAMPHGAAEGENGFGNVGYGGPCPPPGKPHHYNFLLYGLNETLNLPAGAALAQVESAMRGHIVASGKLIGTYGRGN